MRRKKNILWQSLIFIILITFSSCRQKSFYTPGEKLSNPSNTPGVLLADENRRQIHMLNKTQKERLTTQYQAYFHSNEDSIPIKKLLDSINCNISREYLRIENIVKYVQNNIEYNLRGNPYIVKSSIETLKSKTGVCTEKSVLLGKMLYYSGYNIAFFIFPHAKHVGLGIHVPKEYGSFNTSFSYIESTSNRSIGDIPFEYFTEIRNTTPFLITIDSSKATFNDIVKLSEMYKDYIEQYGEENVNIPDSAKYYMQKGYALRPELHSLLSENNYLYDYYNQLVEQGLTDSTSIKKADSVYYYLEKVNNKHQILLKKYNHHKNNFERIIKEYNDNL